MGVQCLEALSVKCRSAVQMKDYCTDTKACRHALLLAYFGERFAAGRCERCCDNCLARQQGSAPVDNVWLVSRPTVVCGLKSWHHLTAAYNSTGGA